MLLFPCPSELGVRSLTTTVAWILLFFVACWVPFTQCMTVDELRSLRRETIDVFYHGYDNYMTNAFPEDELKPLSCRPLTRDRQNPAHIEVNDVLGNYSLTLIDSLSTLAILASSPDATSTGHNPLADFQDGIALLVDLYGDGSPGALGQGTRSRGFDLDSKVQVFETVIRGVGGLLSAHLFAVGDLPISTYQPVETGVDEEKQARYAEAGIHWPNGFIYDGQLLRLALDLANRLLPAFHSVTGLPYPRVNLRHGIPFYTNSPLNYDAARGQCEVKSQTSREITETCSAGAGSLVLEFATLSRLSGDPRYEEAAKTAFWAVWERRTSIDLIGAGIDAETGLWVAPFSGIGAGIDSFFEYAFKSHVLLSGTTSSQTSNATMKDSDFLPVWLEAHAGIKRHLYRGSAFQHPHYIQGDLYTGAVRAFWIDSLSAYYPGLLTLAGELDEAISSHLLYAALWSRYSALPERWSAATGNIDSGLRWWGGRPEFIESTWYLYRATQDPWYLHVGEMALRDIKRRCWTECGWAGLEDVRTGELKDRMESFFLGETVKYLYLLFDPTHPLNTLDAPFVFTTEGHPLILPESTRQNRNPSKDFPVPDESFDFSAFSTCPSPPSPLPFSISATTSRQDFFHAASLARLHQMPVSGQSPGQAVESAYDLLSFSHAIDQSPTNYTYYPWTIPIRYVPTNGTSSKMEARVTFDLTFPVGKNNAAGAAKLERVDRGVLMKTIGGVRLGLIRERSFDGTKHYDVFRIHSVSQIALGRDEEVFLTSEAIAELNPVDPYFTRRREVDYIDLVVDDVPITPRKVPSAYSPQTTNRSALMPDLTLLDELKPNLNEGSIFSMLLQHISSAFDQGQIFTPTGQEDMLTAHGPTDRASFAAAVSTGIGAGPLPDVGDASLARDSPLDWTSIFVSDETCDNKLPNNAPRKHHIIVIKRGGCSFSQKLRNIPSFIPSSSSLKLVIVVSFPEHEGGIDDDVGSRLIRPLLDEVQYTHGGVVRYNQIPMVMVEGGEEVYEMLRTAKGIGLRRRYWFESQGLRISNLIII